MPPASQHPEAPSPPRLPLELAEHHLLQVLLHEFEIEKIDGAHVPGIHLMARFEDASEAIWQRQQRTGVMNSIGGFAQRAARIDGELTAFLKDPSRSRWRFSDPEFVFRYGNGGTLPIIRLDSREYYCLAYRDIAPIGWNLANGASDSRHELLNPLNTIERELREEILIVDEERKVRYVLQWEDDQVLDRPEFMLAREFWQKKRRVDIASLEERIAPVTWIHGPDAITVRCPGQVGRSTTEVFLNISAADFGIEVDRIAKIHVDDGAIVLDGETHGSRLVDRPIGLFEVDRFAESHRAGETSFVPDLAFISGNRVEGTDRIAARIVDACAPSKRPLRSHREHEEWDACEERFGLCPVAEQLVARHLEQEALLEHDGRVEDHGPYRVFISSTGHEEDWAIADTISSHLSRHPAVGGVFFYKNRKSPMSMDWLRAIEAALLDADSMIIVCTDVERVRSLDFEWQPFFIWTRYGRKTRGQIVPVVHRVKPHELPLPLCAQDAVQWSPDDSTPLDILTHKVTTGTSHGRP